MANSLADGEIGVSDIALTVGVVGVGVGALYGLSRLGRTGDIVLHILGIGLVAGIAGMLIYYGGDPAPLYSDHYRVLFGCDGIEIRNEDEAYREAYLRGAEADEFGPKWLRMAERRLLIDSARSCEAYPPDSRAFAYRILRSYAAGAVNNYRVPLADALAILAETRSLYLSRGVPEAGLPAGF